MAEPRMLSLGGRMRMRCYALILLFCFFCPRCADRCSEAVPPPPSPVDTRVDGNREVENGTRAQRTSNVVTVTLPYRDIVLVTPSFTRFYPV